MSSLLLVVLAIPLTLLSSGVFYQHCRIVILARGFAVMAIVSVLVLKKSYQPSREECSFPSLLPPPQPPPPPSLIIFLNKHHAPSAAAPRRTHSARREPRAVLAARNSAEKPRARAQKKRRFFITIL